ncbi:MAG: IPT/TIG domain-containing protein [Candidatus Nanopelagicales bacterium]
MANDASKVHLIADGEIWLKEYDGESYVISGATADPEDLGFTHIGYYSSDGFTEHIEPGDTTTHKAQNGEDVVDRENPGHVTLAFSALETRKEVVEAYWDTTVQPDGSYTIATVGSTRRYALILRGISHQEDQLILSHQPHVKVAEREDITFNPETLKAYGMTFRTFKDDGFGYHKRDWDTSLIEVGPPTITAASPSGAEEDDVVTITGTNFTGATAVTFGGVAAADFDVNSATEIEAIMPAGSAGSAAIIVTTPAGATAGFAYTRGA